MKALAGTAAIMWITAGFTWYSDGPLVEEEIAEVELEVALEEEVVEEESRENLSEAELHEELAVADPELEEPGTPVRTPVSDASAQVAIGQADIIAGESLIASKRAYPAYDFGYDGFRSFSSYAKKMGSLGSKFVVIADGRRIVAGASVERGVLSEIPDLNVFSSRARDFTGELGLADLLRSARRVHGPEAVVMLLISKKIDFGILGAISRALQDRGESHEDFREIIGFYGVDDSGHLILTIEAGIRENGESVPIVFAFDLTRLAQSPFEVGA